MRPVPHSASAARIFFLSYVMYGNPTRDQPFFIIVDRSFSAPQAEYFGLCLLDTPTTVQPQQLMLQDNSTKDEKKAKQSLKFRAWTVQKKTQRSRDQENKEIH